MHVSNIPPGELRVAPQSEATGNVAPSNGQQPSPCQSGDRVVDAPDLQTDDGLRQFALGSYLSTNVQGLGLIGGVLQNGFNLTNAEHGSYLGKWAGAAAGGGVGAATAGPVGIVPAGMAGEFIGEKIGYAIGGTIAPDACTSGARH